MRSAGKFSRMAQEEQHGWETLAAQHAVWERVTDGASHRDGAVTLVRQTAGERAKVHDVKLNGASAAGTLAVLIASPRASWALVMRDRDGRTQAVHTNDAIVCELLRARLAEAVSR